MFHLEQLLNTLRIGFVRLGRSPHDAFSAIVPPDVDVTEGLLFIKTPSDSSLALIVKSNRSVVMTERSWVEAHRDVLDALPKAVLGVALPRLVFAKLLATMYPDEDHHVAGVHPTAHVHPDAAIGQSVSIGPYCLIGNCQIGDGTTIGAFTIVRDNTSIGERVMIREHCVIGESGFGYERDESGKLFRIPHVGRVVIENDVLISGNVIIDRATLTETRVKSGTKIDHFAYIAHNALVEEDCIINSGTVVCGGTHIGRRTWTGVGSIIKEHRRVGEDSLLGLGAVAVNDLPARSIVMGVPAKPRS